MKDHPKTTGARDSEQQFRKIFEDGPVGIALLTRDGEIRHVNRRLCDMLGYSEEAFIELGVRGVTHTDDWEADQRLGARLLAGDIARYTINKRYVRQDGTLLWGQLTVSAMHDDRGRPAGMIGMVEDVTERTEAEAALKRAKEELQCRVAERTADLTVANEQLQREVEQRRRAEESLRQSEARYRTLVEASPDAVVVSDLKGRVLFASQRAAELLGFEAAEAMHGLELHDFVAPEEHSRLAANFQRLIEAGTSRNNEYTGVRQDRSRFPVEVSAVVIRGTAGEPKAVMAVTRDITDRRKAQAAVERERQTLIHMLRASDHERQTIAYDIHDGLAQQLAAATMQFQTYEHFKDLDAEKAKTAYRAGVAMVEQAHTEARRLISGVRPPALDEAGVAIAVAHLIHEQAKGEGPQIELYEDVQFDRLAPIVENAVYRIAQEALTNACRHSRSPHVKVSLTEEDGFLRLQVQDWGVGFDPTSVDNNRFGLEGIKERTRLLGGNCAIESEPGSGTTIAVSLPIVGR